MINKQNIFGLIGLCTKAGGICFGTDACIDLIEKEKLKLLIVAEDAAERTKRNFEFLCNENEVPIVIFGTIEENSKAIGKVNKAVIGIKNNSFAKQLIKKINGGELIG